MKTILYVTQEPEDWSVCFSREFLFAWFVHRERILWVFRWYMTTSVHRYRNLTSYDIFSELKGYKMPRKKGEPNASGDRFKRDNSGVQRNDIKWLNIKLTDEDVNELTASDATFEFLVASVVGLCTDGLALSIKTVDEGKSYCVTLIGSNLGSSGAAYGLSSFAGELRDALLVSLYKFDTYLEGDISNGDKFVNSTQQDKRFR